MICEKEGRKRKRKIFPFYRENFLFFYGLEGYDINYNSKHVSPLFQGFLNDHLKRDCKLEESTEFEDERVRKQWTERLIIPKA